jgi:elongator complex protein 3
MKLTREKIVQNFLEYLIERGVKDKQKIEILKKKFSKKFRVPLFPNSELLKAYQKLKNSGRLKKSKEIEKILKKRPIRSLSGIVNISVLTKPYFCPGKCIFCPIEENFPKSYLSGEPAADRARTLNFDPFLQVKTRVQNLQEIGHFTDKIELRIIGGTWSVYPIDYRYWFVKECFLAANNKIQKQKRKIKENLFQLKKELLKEQKKNEKAKNRIVGISIETRPDFISENEVKILRELGITMVEMGVQNVFDEILEKNQCGFNSEKISEATKILKDAGFKILYHLMPNLPGSDLEKDEKMFEIVFNDERFKPDWIKIYPTVVVKGAKLYQIWKEGKYKPYSDEELIEFLIKIKKNLPRWVRIARIMRDIPAKKIEAGCKISNLRQKIQEIMKKRKLKCKCIRCREVRENYNPKEKIYLFREDYDASEGKEIFLSFENKNRSKLFSFLRLRIPSQIFSGKKHFLPVLENSAIIREIKTLGELVPIGEKGFSPQHRGLGKKLIKEAEEIAKKEFKVKKVAVISGVGARDYWRKLNYRLKESYMIKKI